MDRRITLVLDEKENHDQSVKRFRSLCDMHRIPFGDARNLQDFITALKEDRHFAMDFWAMVGDLSERERGTLTDDEIVNMLVEGSTGLAISELPLSQKVATAGLKNMLAGIDTESPVLPDTIAEPEDPLLSKKTETPSPKAEIHGAGREEAHTVKSETAAGPIKARISIEDALRRLEETSRELRDQLSSIEQLKKEDNRKEISSEIPTDIQESLVEPPPVETAPAIEVPTPPAPLVSYEPKPNRRPDPEPARPLQAKPATEPDYPVPATPRYNGAIRKEAVRAPRSTPAAKMYVPPAAPVGEPVIFAPRPFGTLSHRGLAPQDIEDDPSIGVPLSAYAETHPRRIGVGAMMLIILLLLIGGAWFALHNGYGQEALHGGWAAFRNKVGLFGQELHDLAVPSSKAEPNQQQTPPAKVEQPASLKPSQANDSTQLSHSASASPRSAATESPRPVPQPTTVQRPAPATATPVPRPEQTLAEREAVRVSASVMEANLISSRVPVYPEAAKAMGIEGTVVVETIVSRSGAVEYARAISGDPRLRAAAEEAVMKWRYKPYSLNGTPIEAATQVRVAFRLPN